MVIAGLLVEQSAQLDLILGRECLELGDLYLSPEFSLGEKLLCRFDECSLLGLRHFTSYLPQPFDDFDHTYSAGKNE